MVIEWSVRLSRAKAKRELLMFRRLKAPLAISMLMLFTCSLALAKVTVDWDKGADFTKYKTYAWGKGTPASNPLMNDRIIAAIDNELAAKGFQKVEDPASADLLVIYHAAVSEETQLNTTDMGGGWGWRWGGGMSTTTVDKIPKGQLVVDIGDAKTKKVLWMGNASETLSDNPDKNADKVNKVTREMFKKFPPPVKK
jgi:hypothetical protein